jgi:hypothetical protein
VTIDADRLTKLADELEGCEVWPDIELALREAAKLLAEPRYPWVPSKTPGVELLHTGHGVIELESRPHYCDRGSFIVRLHPMHGLQCPECCIDEADMFPRYYFDERRAKLELEAWAEKRGWFVPGPPP